MWRQERSRPRSRSGSPANLPATQGLTKQERQEQLTSMTTKELRKLAAVIVGGKFPSAPNRNVCIDEILNKEYRVVKDPNGGGGESIEDSDPDNEADIGRKSVKELQAIASAQNIIVKRGARKADIVSVIKAGGSTRKTEAARC